MASMSRSRFIGTRLLLGRDGMTPSLPLSTFTRSPTPLRPSSSLATAPSASIELHRDYAFLITRNPSDSCSNLIPPPLRFLFRVIERLPPLFSVFFFFFFFFTFSPASHVQRPSLTAKKFLLFLTRRSYRLGWAQA